MKRNFFPILISFGLLLISAAGVFMYFYIGQRAGFDSYFGQKVHISSKNERKGYDTKEVKEAHFVISDEKNGKYVELVSVEGRKLINKKIKAKKAAYLKYDGQDIPIEVSLTNSDDEIYLLQYTSKTSSWLFIYLGEKRENYSMAIPMK